jgi:SM-20-related protein
MAGRFQGSLERTMSTKTAIPPFEINDALDRDKLRKAFRLNDRLHIPNFLSEASAKRLHKCLAEEVPWEIAFNRGEEVMIASATAYDGLAPQKKAELLQEIMLNAREKFQFFYDSYRIDVAIEAGTGDELYLHRYYEFMNSELLLDFMRDITGMKSMALADGQATRFKPSSFLTDHNDYDLNKGRLCAYVMNLTPEWRPDWGGILNFFDKQGNVIEGFTPRWNTLNLLRVPQAHSVSYVPPFAGAHRLSITGWLREAT